MRHLALSAPGVMSDELRTGSTAAANDVDNAFVDELGNLRSHRFCGFIILSHLVRQSGIRMRTNIIRCNLCQMLDERFHLRRSEGTVHAHGEDWIRRERSQEGIYGLTAEGSARQVTHRKTDHDRQLHPVLLHHGDGCINHCLAVERIEDGFDEDDIRSAFDETIHLFADIGEKFIVGDFTGGRIADVRTHGASLVGRSHVSCNEAWLIGCRELVAFDASQSCALESHFACAILQMIICLRDTLAREGVRRDDVGARLQIASVDIRDDIRASDVEHIVVALHHARHVAETFATEVILH